MQRVVITGVGLASGLGNDLASFCAALAGGRHCIRPVPMQIRDREWEPLVGALPEIPKPAKLTKVDLHYYRSLTLLACYCAEQCLAGAGLEPGAFDPRRAGVVFGSGFINLYDLEPVYEEMYTRGPKRVSPATVPLNMPSTPVSRISMDYGFRGVTKTVSTACSSAATALLDAHRLIAHGEQDVVLAGGADLIARPTLVLVWEKLRVLSPEPDPARACRPFDRDRNGLILGEGGAMFALESEAHARARGAAVLAYLDGGSENTDGFDMVKPSLEQQRLCMRNALEAAGVEPGQVASIQTHGTATRLNDEIEHLGLREVFGDRLDRIPLCAIKSMLGHTMGASGAMSLAAALGSLEWGHFYPVPNLERFDEGVHLNVARQPGARLHPGPILINSFAFGGINACLVASRP